MELPSCKSSCWLNLREWPVEMVLHIETSLCKECTMEGYAGLDI